MPAQNPHNFLPVRLDMPYMMGTELENMRVHLLEELGLSQSVEVTKAGLTKRLENLARVCGLNTFINEEMRDEWIELDMDKDDIPVSDVRAVSLVTPSRMLTVGVASHRSLRREAWN